MSQPEDCYPPEIEGATRALCSVADVESDSWTIDDDFWEVRVDEDGIAWTFCAMAADPF